MKFVSSPTFTDENSIPNSDKSYPYQSDSVQSHNQNPNKNLFELFQKNYNEINIEFSA